MNALQLAQRLKRESGRSGVGPITFAPTSGEDLLLVDAVKDAWRNLQTEPRDWRWMRATALAPLQAGTVTNTPSSLGVSATLERWRGDTDDYRPTVFNTSNAELEWPLHWLPYDRFRARFIVGTHAAGRPRYWSTGLDNSFLVGPRPDLATYQLRADYQSLPVELAADLDVPAMPSRHHMAIVWAALMQIAGHDAANEHYVRARDAYDDLYDVLIRDQADPITITARPLGV